MKLEFLILVMFMSLPCIVQGEVLLQFEGEGSEFRESINNIIGNMGSKTTDYEGSGDDTDYSGSGDEDTESSGDIEGSGITTTWSPVREDTTSEIVDINVVTPTTETETEKPTSPKTTSLGNEVDVEETSENPITELSPNEDDDQDDNYDDDGTNNRIDTIKAPANPQKSTGHDEKQKGVSFTLGIIIGVVVGAILAILIIVILVYRLRKKDEGSYSLDESSTQFIRDPDNPQKGDKEYFA